MTCLVSVLVPLGEPVPTIVEFVRALDLQSLPSSDYQTIFVSRDESVSERLDRLQDHRPNVVIHRSDSIEVADLLKAATLATGEYVLMLQPEHLPLPESLERLHGAAVDDHLDLVLGRPAGRFLAGPEPEPLSSDRGGLDPAEVLDLLDSPAVLVRRSLLPEPESAPTSATSWRELLAGLLDPSLAAGVQGSYPAVRSTAVIPLGLDSSLAESPSRPDVSWVDGRLRFQAADSTDTRQSRVVLRHDSGLEFCSPLSPGQEAIDIDIRTAAAGAALAAGLWTVAVREVDPESGQSDDRLVEVGSLGGCLVDDVVVLPARNEDQVLVLDVGATKTPLAPVPDPSHATIQDNVRGALLQLDLPGLAAAGTGSVPGHVLLKGLALPGRLLAAGQHARIECYVSGLAGSYPLALKFGRPKSPTNLNLVFSGTGDISVVTRPKPPPRPAPAAKAPAKKSPAKKAPAKKQATAGSTTLSASKAAGTKKAAGIKKAAPRPEPRGVARIRRLIPQPLEPAVRRIRRNPVARAAYRKLSGL